MKKFAVVVLLCLGLVSVTRSDANVEEINAETFDAAVKNSPLLLVLFSEAGCGTCATAQGLFTSLTPPDTLPSEPKKVLFGDKAVAEKYGIKDFPALLFFRDGIPTVFDGEWEAMELQDWLFKAAAPACQTLYDGNFEHLTQAATGATTGDWLVVFYRDTCATILPALEAAGIRLRQIMNTARVDMGANPKLVERFKLSHCPSVLLFRQGKLYRYDVNTFDAKSLTSFATVWYKNLKAERVPGEVTAFDKLTDYIVQELKDAIANKGKKLYIIVGVGAGVVVSLLSILICCCCCRRSSTAKSKTD